IPNVTFSKNNFTSYNFSIRGIGTKAVSATTDPGVAVSFNNISLIQNRLFEQEYFDVERVEVLRGPQGTLYGRNATAGVINVISAKPNLHEFSGWIKGEVGNYHAKRISAMLNVPLVEDKLGIRVAGALTDRQGYDYNSVTNNHVNGRDLWSGRITVGFNPTEDIRSNLIWERFNEDDNRSRTGKQLCHYDPGRDSIAGVSTRQHATFWDRADGTNFGDVMVPALFSQGCKAGSLYDDSAFGTPNGLALPFVFGVIAIGADCGDNLHGEGYCGAAFPPAVSVPGTNAAVTLLDLKDPYGGLMQSRDLRTIASFRDPRYRANADIVEFNVDVDLPHSLVLSSQTAYDADEVYSFQDYNRFNTQPIFADTTQWHPTGWQQFFLGLDPNGPSAYYDLAPGGYFCDPQLGCSNTLAGFDISTAKSKQFSQEVRLQSNSGGALDFSVGANYTRFSVLVDYYIMYNMFSAMAVLPPFNQTPDITRCYLPRGFGASGFDYSVGVPIDDPTGGCPYIDPNPVESINGDGHNYFRSKNPYKLNSSAAFGEIYWKITQDMKLTAGLRYTDDKKVFTPVPSQILAGTFVTSLGTVNRGYPEKPKIKQHWGEFTGRLGVEYKPDLSFTDQTMVYGFYSRGYKGGGANPPSPGFPTQEEFEEIIGFPVGAPPVRLTAVNYGQTFRPEFVNAFEVGAKNTLAGGALVLNGDAFFYDYKDYQVSKIVDRTAVNENFDARVWGLELETVFSPSGDIHLNANLGYLDSAIGSGAKSIDVMDRTAGDPRYVVLKPWIQLPSNCVAPAEVAAWFITHGTTSWPGSGGIAGWHTICGGAELLMGGGNVYDPLRNEVYDPLNYPEINGGAGIAKNLKGNELPNSPHWTANVGAQYSHDFGGNWRATVRADGYWQSQSWARVYNAVNDKLHGWYNANLSLWLENDQGLKIEFYAKNILDKSPITDAFINSDDTGLTTNVFTLDPRLIGLSIKKGF
ncbi:MAG: TonB-dependent receptor, partial [Ignavibacteriales bacterium]